VGCVGDGGCESVVQLRFDCIDADDELLVGVIEVR
jgi:hypothetical protein